MKTTILAVVSVVVAVLIVGLLSLNYLTSNPHVEITSFNTLVITSGSSSGLKNVRFVLNLTNTGTVDAKDLTVTFSTNRTIEDDKQLTYTNSTPPYNHIAEFTIGEPCLLGGLKAKETKEFTFYWPVSVDSYEPTLTATLKSNQAILDQAIKTVPPIPNVRITNFVCTGVWGNSRLGSDLDLFSLNYTNLGTIDVENLTITLNTSRTNESDIHSLTIPYRYLDEYINGDNYSLESIKVNETKNFEKGYLISLFNLRVEPFALTATLKSNDTILDQATIMIPISGD